MTEALDVCLYGQHAATLTFLGPSRYRLDYLPSWTDHTDAVPASLSLPLVPRRHEGAALSDFIDNLLPDNTAVRDRWAVEAGLANTEPFGLLGAYGQDVAGAIQFVEAGTGVTQTGNLEPVDDADVARRIRMIRDDSTLWNDPTSSTGRFSLGGAQAKFALARVDGRWFDPSGTYPATHIFKPKVQSQTDGELIEFVTMRAAALLRLPVAEVSVDCFGAEHSLVVRRFDRVQVNGGFERIHQEDLAQALAVPRLRKSESDGGPGYRRILSLFGGIGDPDDAAASKDVFVKGLIYSWLVLNTDAHAKNYSLRLAPGRTVIAPLYDLSSLIPYIRPAGPSRRELLEAYGRTKLSMRVASSYESSAMGGFEWRGVARDAGLGAEAVTGWAKTVASLLPDVIAAAASALPAHLQTDTVGLYVDRVGARTAQALEALGA